LLVRETDESDSNAAAGLTALGHEIGRVFAAHNVATDRVAIFPLPAGAREDLRTLLGIADIHLDGIGGADPIWAAEALALGRPVVALAGEDLAQSRGTAGLLASLGLEELVAADEVAYEALAAQLAGNLERREAVGARIQTAMESAPGVLDRLAASDGFGALIETAFDELAALGLEQFRAQREPLRCFAPEDVAETVAAGEAALAAGEIEAAAAEASLALRADPRHPGARSLRGRVLLAEGEPARAVVYLLAAVEQRSDDAALWFALAGALRQNQQGAEAVQALETSLRLDRTQVEAWLMLLDIAESGGAVEIAAEARHVLREIAPDDPRVAVLA
jgi:predicted O-linked N-acetylglucosamine transferase (SPINDLY family)